MADDNTKICEIFGMGIPIFVEFPPLWVSLECSMYCNLFLAFSLIGMDSLEGVKLWADIKFLVYMAAAASAFSLGGQIESLTTTWQELPSNEVEKSFLHYICIFNRTVSSHHHKGHS